MDIDNTLPTPTFSFQMLQVSYSFKSRRTNLPCICRTCQTNVFQVLVTLEILLIKKIFFHCLSFSISEIKIIAVLALQTVNVQ